MSDFKRYRVSYVETRLCSAEVVAESKAAAKRIAEGKQPGERGRLRASPASRSSFRIVNEEPADAPRSCKGCGETVGKPHASGCPYEKASAERNRVQDIQTRIEPV